MLADTLVRRLDRAHMRLPTPMFMYVVQKKGCRIPVGMPYKYRDKINEGGLSIGVRLTVP